MKTSEVFCVCIVLTPILGITDGGTALVIMLWIFFAYKAYMNHLHQKEVDYYKFMKDNMTYEDQRIFAKMYERKINEEAGKKTNK